VTEEISLVERVREAASRRTPLAIHGGRTKAFYGRAIQGTPLDLSTHAGVVSYAPTELVLTARAGTPLTEIDTLLAEHGQMLPFEPPYFGSSATFGGMLAAGLSGPRRSWGGGVRDALLGVKLINGRGDMLNFGGQVMKNVAGYDVSRLMAGSMGTLAVILEASVKVLPRPAVELTLVQEAGADEAARRLIAWGRKPLPLSASLHHAGRLWVRLSGSAQGVDAARAVIGGEAADPAVWTQVREQTLPLFHSDAPLWRLSLPAAAPPLDLLGEELSEWGGALRWLRTSASAESVRRRVAALGGHATLFRGHDGTGQLFQPLPPPLLALHQRLKAAFDPLGLFNPGRMYPEL
jgi:glycolate oxidase FAD binding subunit